jgi:hypothetical protein
VEADQVVLNLTTIETQLPERRPFFLEGADIFATPGELLYTRRIGRVPELPRLPAGETAREGVGASAIPGALKLVGRLGDRPSVGALAAMSGPNTVPTEDANGQLQRRVADPLTTYEALRLRRSIGDRSYVGFMGTAVNRCEDRARNPAGPSGERLCPGRPEPTSSAACWKDAYVASLDGRWQSPSGNYMAGSGGGTTILSRGPPRRMRDGTEIRPDEPSAGAGFFFGKYCGRRWLWNTSASVIGRTMDWNDLGFMSRQNAAAGSFDLTYRTREPWWVTRETSTKLELRHQRSLDGRVLADYHQVNSTWHLPSHHTVFFEAQLRRRWWEDREVGDGTALERAGLWGLEASVEGDPRRALSGRVFGVVQRRSNGFTTRIDGALTLRPAPWFDVDLLPELVHAQGEPRFISEEAQGASSLAASTQHRSAEPCARPSPSRLTSRCRRARSSSSPPAATATLRATIARRERDPPSPSPTSPPRTPRPSAPTSSAPASTPASCCAGSTASPPCSTSSTRAPRLLRYTSGPTSAPPSIWVPCLAPQPRTSSC